MIESCYYYKSIIKTRGVPVKVMSLVLITRFFLSFLKLSFSPESIQLICLILFEIIGFFSNDISLFLIGTSFSILFPIYLYKSLRNFYQSEKEEVERFRIYSFSLIYKKANILLSLFLSFSA